jgi:hypothetical protein
VEPPAVTATATVMIALTPGARPRPVIVDARRAAELARAFTDARIACLAGQEALDGIAAYDALAARQDLADTDAAVVDATIHEEWCDGGHDDSGPCVPSADRFLKAEPEPGTQAYADKYASRTVQSELLDHCPDGPTVKHGACARLAGHPAPHRDGGGREWVGEPAVTAEDGGCLMQSPGNTYCTRPAGHDVIDGSAHRDANGMQWDDDGVILHQGGTATSPPFEAARPDSDADEPMPVSFLPLRRAARIGGGA